MPESLLDLEVGEVVEVPLLLPGWQISALEREAHHRGLTAGEMLRHLLSDFIAGHDTLATAKRCQPSSC